MNIILDAMGGDNAPLEILKGAGYVMTCYELLPENEKVDFLNLKEKYEKEFNALW